MTAKAVCDHCGSTIGADAIAGQCPVCLLNVALSGEDRPPGTHESFASSRRRFGDYELGRQIGAGGMGVVYEARRVSDGARVGLKLIRHFHTASPMELCRFTIEAEAVSRLDHPAIVRIHEVGECDGQPYFSMDLVEGQSLNERIVRGDLDLSQTDMARFMTKLARAVHHAHLRGVLHRDLKPANIIVDPQGEPHLTDFGLAKILQPEADARALTASGDAPGTPSFMSPEQVRGGAIGCAADIYGLGAILYALMTGRAPFEGQSTLEVFAAIVSQPPARPRALNRALSPALETICLKCLEKHPGRRYPSAEALANDLENFAEGRPIQARTPGPLHRAGQWIKRNPVGASLIASLGLGLAAALILLSIVNQQRRQIRLDRDLAFDEGMQKISEIWRDPATSAVTISARELNILAGRSPVDVRLAKHQFVLGIGAGDSPSSAAQRYAQILGRMADGLEGELGEKVALHLRLFKRSGEAALTAGQADFIVLSPVTFLQATGLSAIAQAKTPREGVLFARTNLGTADLRGKAIAFTEPDTSLHVWAKARLFAAGLRRRDLARTTNVADSIAPVLRGEFDAGVAPRMQFERYRHLGLVMLDCFPETPNVLAARAGIAPRINDALRRVIGSPRTSDAWPENKFTAPPGLRELEALKAAMEQAELFQTQ